MSEKTEPETGAYRKGAAAKEYRCQTCRKPHEQCAGDITCDCCMAGGEW